MLEKRGNAATVRIKTAQKLSSFYFLTTILSLKSVDNKETGRDSDHHQFLKTLSPAACNKNIF